MNPNVAGLIGSVALASFAAAMQFSNEWKWPMRVGQPRVVSGTGAGAAVSPGRLSAHATTPTGAEDLSFRNPLAAGSCSRHNAAERHSATEFGLSATEIEA
jgi:hypothetical protein